MLGVLAESVPGQLEHLDDVPLGDGLVDPPGEDRPGSLPGPLTASGGRNDGLVGRQEQHAVLLELVLDLRAEVGAASDTVDRFADDGHEAPVGPARLRQQVLDAAVTWDRDVELLMGSAVPAIVQLLAARLHVVEVGHDDVSVRKRLPRLAQLSGEGE
ncbi:hypothetical protein [Actinoallomurus acaciae]|uniref:Uncharacterized protein n=1 Tax=Actinoallomurus acaciae TaxID=502577 RepID=A0ABV5Y8V9_9ACTN